MQTLNDGENIAIAVMMREQSNRNILVDYRRARIGYPYKGDTPSIDQELELAHKWVAGGRIPFGHNHRIGLFDTVNVPATESPVHAERMRGESGWVMRKHGEGANNGQ